jgi:hypothetical protein
VIGGPHDAFGYHRIPYVLTCASILASDAALSLASRASAKSRRNPAHEFEEIAQTGPDSGFTLLNPGTGDRKVAFDEMISVKQLTAKSHTTRNVLIGVGIGVVVTVAVLAAVVGHGLNNSKF